MSSYHRRFIAFVLIAPQLLFRYRYFNDCKDHKKRDYKIETEPGHHPALQEYPEQSRGWRPFKAAWNKSPIVIETYFFTGPDYAVGVGLHKGVAADSTEERWGGYYLPI